MKKQIAIIIVSLLASMSAAAQNVNENYCNDEMCRVHNTPICEAGEGVIQPDFDGFLPDIEIKPETPVFPELPEWDTPTLPDIGVKPEQPETPDVPTIPDNPESDIPNESMAIQVLSLVNAERAKNGLSSLTYDSHLERAANLRAVEIKTLFSHTRPDGTSCFTALDEVGYSYRKAGENIAYGQRSASEVVTAWMNSEGHRANILGDYDYIGIGVYEKGGVIYWSQMFAS